MRVGFLVCVVVILCLRVPVAVRADDACWLTMKSFEPAGASQNGKLTAYEFVLQSDGVGPYTVDFILDTKSGRQYRVKVPTIKPQANRAVTTVGFAFDDQTISALRLDPLTAGSEAQRAACSNAHRNLDPESDAYNEDIFPDPKSPTTTHSDIQGVVLAQPFTIVDADFIKKVVPTYPASAVERGLYGVVGILVRIGPGGKVVDAQVNRTSMYAALDNAALAAARASTYKPPTLNGKPTTRQYKLLYPFTLDGVPAPPLTSECAAELSGASLIGHSGAFNYDVYTLFAQVDSQDVKADIALDVGQADAYVASLRNLAEATASSKPPLLGSVSFLWNGPMITRAWVVHSYRDEGDSKGTPCNAVVFNVLPNLPLTPQPARATSKMGFNNSVDLERIYPADFVERVRAFYPKNPKGDYTDGWVEVLTRVDNLGTPLKADVLRSSSEEALDRSALAAAMSSTYRLHTRRDHSVDGYFYTSSYHFIPEAEWLAHQ